MFGRKSKDSKKEKKVGSQRKKDRKSKIVTAESLAEEAKVDTGPPARAPPTPTEVNNSGDFTAVVEQEQDEEGLIFTGELDNGRPVVKGGNIQKLVERLTYYKYNDAKYVKAFLLTFRSFTTPGELLQLLIDRFDLSPPAGSSAEEVEQFETGELKVVRLRVFNVLKHWLNGGYYDFRQDAELKKALLDFIENRIKPEMENASTSLRKIIEKKESHGEKEYEHMFSKPPPEPILPAPGAKADNILSYSPLELARQLTLIEYRLFATIQPSECVSQHWMSKQKEQLAPNILKMIFRFNEVSTWVQSEIVKCTDVATRTQILKHVIEIAEHCRSLNNFNAVMEIISGLHSSSVFRLKQTWSGLKKGIIASYEEMHELTSRDYSYKNFRAALHSVNPPCIPYLGMYLTDLTFIEEGNQNFLPDGNINFTKRQRLAEVISEIQTYQNTPYLLKEVPSIRKYLENVEALPEEQCYKLSLKREGRRGTAVDNQTPDSPFGDLEVKSSYLFDKPDTDENIMFEKKEAIEGSSVPILAGTLVKLVERLTFHEYQDSSLHSFLDAFLMTLQTFTTPEELLDLLDNRFAMPKPKNPSKQQLERFNKTRMVPIHVRIFNVIKSWVNTYPEDFYYATELQAKLKEYLTSWSEANPTLKPIIEGVGKVLEKKMSEPLPTPECRYIGFLNGESDEFKDKSVLDYDDETLAQQITLIEQNFFASIRSRECLSRSWEPEVMEEFAPNILGMKQNLDVLRRFTLTQVLSQLELEAKYRAITSLVCVAEKLLGLKNFSSSMGITVGLQQLFNEFQELWAWVPLEIINKYKELEILSKVSKRLQVLEKDVGDKVPVIPPIESYISKLSGLATTLPDFTGPNLSLINFELRRKQWEIFRVFQTYQESPYTYDYSGPCGGFLYHAEVWDDDKIAQVLSSVERPAPPEVRPELRDFRSDTVTDGSILIDEDTDLSPRNNGDEEILSQVKEKMLAVINENPKEFQQILNRATEKLSTKLLNDLRDFKMRVEDHIAVMQSDLGMIVPDIHAQQIITRVFPGSTTSSWIETDNKGVVYGWQDQLTIYKTYHGKESLLVHLTTQLNKSNVSSTLRLFQFFSSQNTEKYKNIIITSSADDDAKAIASSKGITTLNYAGMEL